MKEYMNYKNLTIRCINDTKFIVELNRPSSLNALNKEILEELRYFFTDSKIKNEAQTIIVTGCGDKAFCAGADLKERVDQSSSIWKKNHKILQEVMFSILKYPLPVIAAVNGITHGGGLELMMVCDFAYATETATFAQPEVLRGIIPGGMGTQLLPRYIGLNKAKEMCFSGKIIGAKEAYKWGLINKICSKKDLISDILEAANLITKNSLIAIKKAKESLNSSLELGITKGYEYEINIYNSLLDHRDRFEGIRAFVEKRSPDFINNNSEM